MAVASSLQTIPSQIARIVPASHPSIHCGPPMAAMMRGIVMNGPIPTMLVIFSAMASSSPKPRTSPYFFLICWCWSVKTWPPGWDFASLWGGLRGRTLGGCRGCHRLAAIEAIYSRSIGEHGSNEVPHFVEVSIRKADQEVIDNICSHAGSC